MNAYRKKMSRLYKSVAMLLVLLLVGPQNVAALPTPGTMTPVTVGYGYDGNGNLTSRTDGNGNVTTFEYDTMNRLLSIDYPGENSPDVSFIYDQNGNPTSMTDATGTTAYAYDFYDRLIGIDYPDGNFVQYDYDNVDNITDLQYGNRPVLNLSGICTRIHYEFDENNRISTVRNVSTNDTTTYAYYAGGNLSRRALPNGAYTDYGYDNDGRLIAVEHRKQDSSLICKYEYSLNAIGNRTQVIETTPTGTKTTAYRYDALDRLDTVVYPDGRFVDYDYDSFGNRIRMTEAFGGTTKVREYAYDTDSRLLSTTMDGVPEEYFYYDTTGNLIQRIRVIDDRQIDYVYDYENRLVHYFDGTNNVEYVYNGVGERVAKIVNGVRTNFINDPNRTYVQVLAETDDSGVAQRVYEWGNELINREDIDGGSCHYYLYDSINGSVRRVIDANQSVVNSYEYDAFGEVTMEVEGVVNDYQFHGEVQEEETELVFLRARYYDAETGRFLTRDSAEGRRHRPETFNAYQFVQNDAINNIDPSGHNTFFGTKTVSKMGVGDIAIDIIGEVCGFWSDYMTSDPSQPPDDLFEKGFKKGLKDVLDKTKKKWEKTLPHELDEKLRKAIHTCLNEFMMNKESSDSRIGRPGGVALNKSADVLLDINEVTGGTYDPNTGQIILYGKEDSSPTALPPMSIDDLAVAFRAVNLGTMPVVSIEGPMVSSPPEWPGRDCFTVRYGPFYTNSDTGEPEVLDVSSKTHFGWVMYEADRHMKCLGLGKDNRDGTPVTSNVPGYYNSMDLIFMLNLSEGEYMDRFWFHPGEIVVAPSADGRSMELKKAEMQLSTETMFSSGGQVESMPDAEYFARHFTEHYDEFAAEQITYDEDGNPHYIFKELKQLAVMVGIVKWVKEYNIPMDLSFLEDYKPQYYKSAPSHTPVTSVTEISSVDGGLKMATLWGGVNYCSELLDAEGDPSQLATAALDSRTEETKLAWTFNKDGADYNVAALSVDRKEKYGGFSHSDIDAALHVNGASSLVLARHFDSFNVTPTMFGWGWKAQPYALEFKGDREEFNLCTRQWEGFGEVLFNDRGSQAVYKFVPSGIYDKKGDPLGLASRFDPNEEIIAYRYETKDVPGLLFSDNKTRMTMRLADGILLNFDLNGRLTRTEDRNANIIDYTYDANRRLISIGRPGGRTITFTYNDQNRVTIASLPDGHSISYTYDDNGNLKSAQADAPTGRLLQYRYDADHYLMEIQDEKGSAVASLSYDLYGRVTSTTQPGVATPFTRDYSLADKTSQITGPESFSQSMEFNDNHDLIKIADSRGNSSKMAYNSFRDLISMTLPDGWTREYYFDYRGNQMATVLPNGRTDVTIFDVNNNPVDSFHSPANAGFYNSFDPEHVLTSAGMDVDPVNHTQYAYDDKGNLTRVTDANGNEYAFGYDSVGNLIWTKDGQGHQATCVYDEHSRLIRVNNELGHAVGFAYDEEDNLIHVATTAGTVDFAYNDKNQLTRVTTGDPGTRRTMEYTYNAKGQMKTVTDPNGVITEYTYDARGNLTQIRHDGIVWFTYEYDGLNRLTGTHYNGTAGGGRDATVHEYFNMTGQPYGGTEEEASNTSPDESDSDSDGLPDGWEEANGLDPKDPFGDNGPYGDPDGDGYTNREEFFGDSNPNDYTAIPPVPPKITRFTPSGSNPFILEEDEIAFSATATDPNGDSISYSWRLDGLEQATTTSWTFVTTDESSGTNTLFKEYLVELLVTAGGDSVSRKWNTVVKNRNHAPVLQLIPDLSVRPGDAIQLEPVFSDPDNENSVPGDDNTLTVEYLGWMSGPDKTVTLEDYGVRSVTVIVSDDGNPVRTDQQTVHITVEAPNLQPHQPTGWDNNIVVSDFKNTHADVAAIGVGQPCYIDYAEVNNNGSEYAGPSRMRLLVDGVEVDTVARPTELAPQAGYVREDIAHTFMTVGWHTVELIVDADGEVAEGNEGDNSYTKNIYVAPFVKQFEETSYYLKDVCFIDLDIGWAVGEPHWDQTGKRYKRTIIKTVDGGETWIAQEAGVGVGLRGVCFVDADNGWAVGANGTILHTSDGGNNWIKQTVTTCDEFRGVVFTDATHGWATSIKIVGYDWREKPDEWKGSIWHTNDGGQTWTRQIVPNSAGILNRIDFIDSENGWAVGIKFVGYDTFDDPQHVGVVYHTSDGGETWEEQYSPELNVVFTGVDFVDANNGWVVGFKGRSGIEGGTVFHTTDGGITWERQEPSYTLWDVHFLDSNKGYAVGCKYRAAWGPPVLRTIDGGATWETVRMNMHDGEGFYGLAVVGDHVIAVGDHDFLGKSIRAWDSCDWVFPEPTCFDCDCLFEQFYINVHYRFEDVFFVDEHHGWVVGKRSFKPALWGQIILHTRDGGLTWETQYEHAPPDSPPFSYFRLDSVYFTDSQNGWAVGSSESFLEDGRWEQRGAILHTTDGGLNWEEQASELYEFRNLEFFAVHFLDSQNGWALAESHFPDETIFLAHTTDGGTNWAWVDTGIEGHLGIGFANVMGDMVFTDAQHAWAVGGRGKVIHTEDGGATWAKQELPSQRLFSTEFIDNQVGWIAGAYLYSTIDGGTTWIEQDTGVSVDFQDIQFTDSRNGWLAGNSGVMMYTNDGGDTWNRIDNVTSSNLRGISFTSPQKGWAVGDQGIIVGIFSPSISEGDFDNDGLPDNWEQQYFSGLSRDGAGDHDGDGLTDLEEYQNSTDPKNDDTDGDDMPDADGWEVQYNLNPFANDASDDGDGDGLSNLEEFQNGYDPSVAAPVIDSVTASPDTGKTPLEVTFTAASSGATTDWLWDFGDSAVSHEQNPTHTYSQVGTFTVTIKATGPGGPATAATLVTSRNARPVANAGPDQAIGEGEQVILSGRHSHDPNDVVTSYQWAQIAGPAVALINANTSRAFFTAPAVGPDGVALTFQLTVTDSGWLQDTDTVIVNVSWENEPPTADSGPGQTVFWDTAVTLNGSNSHDPDDGIKSYSWKQIAGSPAVTLSDATAVKPTFIFSDVDAKGVSLVFELTITDNGGLQDTDTVIINNVSWVGKAGDIDGSGVIDLRDVILAIKVCAQMNPSSPIFNEADMNGDGKIGLEEALYALQIVAELRPK